MASLLQKSTPWIEDNFIYACSFDASRCDDGSDEEFNDDDEIMEQPQTENTIPEGLHGDDDSIDGKSGRNKPPPRGGKIVQIIARGGDPKFYVSQGQPDKNITAGDCCPPYLIIHDGQYSTIAFLSEETYKSSMMPGCNGNGTGKQPKQIPRKSLISISQFTISTIKCCARHGEQRNEHMTNNRNEFNEDTLPLELVRPDMPSAYLSQVQAAINTNLLLCLYLLGPITLIGGENQGLIGNTMNINCSNNVRRVLLSHMAQFDKVRSEVSANGEEEDYQHQTMVQRLEACHCYYQLLKERQGSTIPMWPWNSRLVGGEGEANNSGNNDNTNTYVNDIEVVGEAVAAPTAASPGRVERMIRKYEDLEELLQEDNADDEQENVDEVGRVVAGRASTGTYLTQWDSDEDKLDEDEEEVLVDEGTKGNPEEQIRQQSPQQEEEGGDGEDDDKRNDAAEVDPPIQQGNVAELFDNFEDINDVLDLEEEEAANDNEEEISPCENAMLGSNDIGVNQDYVDSNVDEQVDKDSTIAENNIDSAQDDDTVPFKGIDQMLEESDDDDDEEEEEEEEEEQEVEQAPLLTQQEFHVNKNEAKTGSISGDLESPDEMIESQIPLSSDDVNMEETNLSVGDKNTKEYVESQIPLPPPKDTQSFDEDDDGEMGPESQIPISFRTNQQNVHASNDCLSDEDEDDAGIGLESQLPIPLRREKEGRDYDEGMRLEESQLPVPQQQSQKMSLSPRKPSPEEYNNRNANSVRSKRNDVVIDDTDDDWMRIRGQPTVKRTRRAPAVKSKKGSEENLPDNVLDTSQIIYSFNNNGEEEEEEDSTEISGEVRKLHSPSPPSKSSASHNNRHRVHFAEPNELQQHADPAAAAAHVPQLINQRELYTSLSKKASEILWKSSKGSRKAASRKRKATEDEEDTEKNEGFNYASLFEKAKKMWLSHPNVEEEDEY